MRGKHVRRVAAKSKAIATARPEPLPPRAVDSGFDSKVTNMAEQKPDYREMCWAGLEVKAIDGESAPDSRVVSYVASSESMDSQGDIVEQDWLLERFAKNPTILYNHGRATGGGFFGGGSLSPEQTLPIGRAVQWGVNEDALHGKHLRIDVEFAPAELNPFADQVFRNVKAGFLKGGSVGFRPHTVTSEVVNDVEIYRLRQNELYEFSIVPIGANADAVTLSAEHSESHRAFLKSIAQKTPPSAQPKEEVTMPEATPVVENAALVPVTAGADVEKLKALELETTSLREKLATRDKADAEREVDALIGKAIVPVQRADFLELRMLSADLFGRISKSLPDLKLSETVIEPAPITIDPETSKSAEGAGARAARQLRPAQEK
jgi:HK97 family phage prohead protease